MYLQLFLHVPLMNKSNWLILSWEFQILFVHLLLDLWLVRDIQILGSRGLLLLQSWFPCPALLAFKKKRSRRHNESDDDVAHRKMSYFNCAISCWELALKFNIELMSGNLPTFNKILFNNCSALTLWGLEVLLVIFSSLCYPLTIQLLRNIIPLFWQPR